MLVLARKIGQQILINDGSIKIKVLGVKGDNIAIGIIAPVEMDVDREEIFYKKKIFGITKPIAA